MLIHINEKKQKIYLLNVKNTDFSTLQIILDLLKKQETLTSVTFERVNLGKVKKTTNAQQVKDAKIALLKAQYKNNDIEVMDYLMKISSFVKNYN